MNQLRNFLEDDFESDSVHSDEKAIDEFQEQVEDKVMLPSLRRVKMQTNDIREKKGKFVEIKNERDLNI